MPSFMMGSPNATVYRLHGVRSILDDLARVGCCGWAAYEPPVRVAADQQGQTLEVAGRAQEGRQRKRVESAQRQRQCWQVTRIQRCSLLAAIEVVSCSARMAEGGQNYGGLTGGRRRLPSYDRFLFSQRQSCIAAYKGKNHSINTSRLMSVRTVIYTKSHFDFCIRRRIACNRKGK